MSSATIQTVAKMLETLPDTVQEQVANHLSEYIEELRAEMQWDESFVRTNTKLQESARKAKSQIQAGKSQPMDLNKL
jgi:hypothetical protein